MTLTRLDELTLAVLEETRKILDVPERWTKGALSRNEFHLALTGWNDPRAVSFCVAGAMGRAASKVTDQRMFAHMTAPYEYAMTVLKDVVGCPGVPFSTWNDAPDRIFDDVASGLDRAIERIRAKVAMSAEETNSWATRTKPME